MFSSPPRLKLCAAPTPFAPLPTLSRELGGPRLWVKRDDCTGVVGSGNKLRKLEFIAAEAIADSCDTLISCGGVQSNHCRTIAWVGARLGLRVHLLLRLDGEAATADTPDGNLLLSRLFGARVECFERADYQRRLEQLMQLRAEEYAARGHRARIVPTGASDATGVWGYVEACRELVQDFRRRGIAPRHLVVATGSGGTLAGLTAGIALTGLKLRVWGVNICDDRAWFEAKVHSDLEAWVRRYAQSPALAQHPVHIIEGYAGPGYARCEAPVWATIGRVAASEGLVLDPVYTGKAFHALLAEWDSGRFDGGDDIVFLHTGGIFGLFPQREQLRASVPSLG